MRVLVTGGLGFIGSNLIDRLTFDGHEVVVLDDFSRANLSRMRFPVTVVRGTVASFEHIADAANPKPDVIVHLAATGGVLEAAQYPDEAYTVNAFGALNVLEYCRKSGIPQAIIASSAGAVAGDVDGVIKETTNPRPRSVYGAAKLSAESLVHAYPGSCALRFSNVYGPGSFHKPNLIPRLCRIGYEGGQLEVRGNGYATRDYVYVGDVVEGICKAITYKPERVLNLASGYSHTLNEVVRTFQDVSGVQVPMRYTIPSDNEVSHVELSCSLAAHAINYFPQVSLRDGLKRTWEVYNEWAA